MPRIPNREVEDDFADYEDFSIEEDDPRDRHGRRLSPEEHRKVREWEEQRRAKWRRRGDE
jgi:hypothetical protein